MSTIILKTRSEWIGARQNGLGASDAAAVLGMSPWKTNVQLWQEKTGQRKPEDISDRPQVQYGHDAEPHLRALFAIDHPEYRVTYDSPYKIIRNDNYPYIFCSPDGELEEIETGRTGGLEIKTTEIMHGGQWAEWDQRIPDQYYCQVLHQMLAAGWEYVVLVAQIKWTDRHGQRRKDTREYRIERSEVEEDIEALEQATIEFWDHVIKGICPPLKLPAI